MVKIIIFGSGSGYKRITNGINENDVDIVCICDNDKKKINTFIDDKYVISPSDIYKYDYDYIVIASKYSEQIIKQLKNIGVKESKIIDGLNIYNQRINNKMVKQEFLERLNLDLEQKAIEVIATGMSYSLQSINKNVLNKKVEIFALRSQDLYYDLLATQYILNRNNSRHKVKYAIIGLAYYSFNYDLSLRKDHMKYRCIDVYEPIFNETHNYNKNENMNQERLLEYILNNQSENNDFEYLSEYRMIKQEINQNNRSFITQKGKEIASKWENKIYIETIFENINTFKKLIEILLVSKIQPIVVIFPTHESYHKNFPKKAKSVFHNILNMFKEMYGFEVHDFFESNLFNDCDFLDSDHLNYNGSIKFTKLLNEELGW